MGCSAQTLHLDVRFLDHFFPVYSIGFFPEFSTNLDNIKTNECFQPVTHLKKQVKKEVKNK